MEGPLYLSFVIPQRSGGTCFCLFYLSFRSEAEESAFIQAATEKAALETAILFG